MTVKWVLKLLPGLIILTFAPVESQRVWKPKSGWLFGLRVRLTLKSLWSAWNTHTHMHTHVKVTPCDPMSCASWQKLDTSEVCYINRSHREAGLFCALHTRGSIIYEKKSLFCVNWKGQRFNLQMIILLSCCFNTFGNHITVFALFLLLYQEFYRI